MFPTQVGTLRKARPLRAPHHVGDQHGLCTVIVSSSSSPRRSHIMRRPSMPTADRTCATVLERGNGWVLAMLVPPVEAGGPARGCAPAALPRGAVAPPCAPWLSSSVGARSAPTYRHARSPRGVEQGAAFWFARRKNVRVRLVAARCTVILTCQGRPHKGLAGPGRDEPSISD